MKYVLVDQEDDIVDRVGLTSNVGVSGARMFFIGRKQIDAKEFDKLWRVMTEESYTRLKNTLESISTKNLAIGLT